MWRRHGRAPALLAGVAAAAGMAALAVGAVSDSAAWAGGSSGAGVKTVSQAHLRPTDPVPAGFSSGSQAIGLQTRLHKAALRITDAAEASGGDQLGSVTADVDDRA